MIKVRQQMFLKHPKAIRNLGILLFLASFLVPAPHIIGASDHFFAGGAAFIMVPFVPFMRLTGDDPIATANPSLVDSLYALFICGLCCLPWIANFTIFFRLPLIAVLVTVAAPLIAFIWSYPLMADFFPFYFWVIGIALIHASRLLSPTQKKEFLNKGRDIASA